MVHSLQKSATGLAQTAVLWQQGERVDIAALQRSLGWLQTTSPSALLLASCETALHHWRSSAGRRQLRQRLMQARTLRDQLRRDGLPLLTTDDPLRLVLHSGRAGISGLDADDWLLPRGLVAELPEPATLTFCLGLADQRGLRRTLRRAWQQLLNAHPDRAPQPHLLSPPLPLVAQPEVPLAEAWRAPRRLCALEQAEGTIAADLLCPYPPGIPLLVPGERLDGARLHWLLEQRQLWGDQIPARLAVLTEIA